MGIIRRNYVKITMAYYREDYLIYILWGEDQFSLEEELRAIKESLGDASMLSTNTSVLEGKKLTRNVLKSVGETIPFLAEKRLVIIRGLLERFEPKDKSSRPKKSSSSNAKQDDSQSLAECIKGFPDSTILVMTDTLEMKRAALQNNPLYQAIASGAIVKPFPVLKGIKLSQWIQSRVTQKGSSISRQATNILMETIGGDLFTLSNEISKLVAFTGGRLIEEKDVRAVVSASQESDIFAMVDAVMDHKAGIAEQILYKLLQRGTVAPQILALIARQIQMLVQMKDLKSRKRPISEIQRKLGIYNPYIWEKLSGRAEKYTIEKLKNIYQSLLKTDMAIKTGQLDGDLALNLLIAELCENK